MENAAEDLYRMVEELVSRQASARTEAERQDYIERVRHLMRKIAATPARFPERSEP
jgi:hypothetical protein